MVLDGTLFSLDGTPPSEPQGLFVDVTFDVMAYLRAYPYSITRDMDAYSTLLLSMDVGIEDGVLMGDEDELLAVG